MVMAADQSETCGVRPTRTPVLVAAATVAALAVTACGTPAQPSADSARPAATSAVPSAVPSAAPSPPAPTPATSPSPTPFTGVLEVGSTSDAVVQLQQRLTELGYWIGTVDGKFGTLTEQALWALQRTAGLAPSGTTTTATWNALTAGTRPKARSTSGHVIEVDLKHELVLFVTNGHVDTILHTSTGGGYSYVSEGVRSLAITPKGHFATYRVIDANHKAPLGWMYRPRYFTGGVAIHGDASVPNRPVSHGCVRVTNAAMDWIWSNNLDPIGTSVWVY
jgi:lipoprotein-anchoring transpeptidase ErfK/SrfK